MDKQQEQRFVQERHGQNLARFTQMFFRFGFVLPPDEAGAKLHFGSSVEFSLGFRHKYKISNVYSLGFETEATYVGYRLRQESGKRLPDTTLHRRERLETTSLGVNFFNRINLDPGRGNTIGKYIDLCVRGQYTFFELMRKNNLPDGSRVRSVISRLPYVNHYQAQAMVKLGIGHFAVYGAYRFTDAFRGSYNYPELPRATAGIEIGLY